jgi:resuscitation-promoting factor RpfB
MASSKLDMSNWTVTTETGMSLAQAFGVDKGTVSLPKLTAKLPVTQQSAVQAQNTPAGDSNPPTAKTEHDNYELAVTMAAAQPYNWSGSQMTALNNIVMAESGWNQTAENSSSGAYGIPQALPGSKMASAGKDWQTDAKTQIAWMLEYIRSRYGNPATAWQFHLAHGWY